MTLPDSAPAWEDCLETFVGGAVRDGLGLGRAAVVAARPAGVCVWVAGDSGGHSPALSVGGDDGLPAGLVGWLWLRLPVVGGGEGGVITVRHGGSVVTATLGGMRGVPATLEREASMVETTLRHPTAATHRAWWAHSLQPRRSRMRR